MGPIDYSGRILILHVTETAGVGTEAVSQMRVPVGIVTPALQKIKGV
jgi:hypothetical protein